MLTAGKLVFGFVFFFSNLISSDLRVFGDEDSYTINRDHAPAPPTKPKWPVVLVPGDGGSQMEARLNKPSYVHYWCTQKTKDWFAIWLNLELLAPYVLDCFVDNMKLNYDNVTRLTYNQPGVELRQPGWGNTSHVEWLDSSQLGPTYYFYHLVDQMVKNLTYTRNVNVRGAPYDFRKGPNEMQDFIAKLKTLIEDTYKLNNNTRVVLIGHSMGNPYVLCLLYKQSQSWKDKYIRTFVSISAPWGGAVKTLRLMASGDNLGIFVVNPLTARAEQRSMPSTAWMLPVEGFWTKDEVLVHGPEGNYTVRDYKQFFDDIDHPNGYKMWEDTYKYIKDLKPPGVEVHCLYGVGVETPGVLNYTASDWFDNQPAVTFDDGDGTVNVRSLKGCLRWQGKQGKHKVFSQNFTGPMAKHIQMLDNDDVKAYIIKVLEN